MPTDPKLEQYLAVLDRALGQIPVSDRADIVTEIKSHVLEARERDADSDIGKILASIGEPETVANRYLLERGLKPGRPSRSPIVKWLTIGFLGTFALLLIAIFALLAKFSPLVKIDDSSGRVSLLGGMIDVSDSDVRIDIEGEHSRTFEGSAPAAKATLDRVHVPFKNGKFEVRPAESRNFEWKCRVAGLDTLAAPKIENREMIFKLDDAAQAKCDLRLPAGVGLRIDGVNGKVKLDRPRGPVEIKLVNGALAIEPDAKEKYRYDFNVKNGVVDRFDSSDAKDAISIRASLMNGKIRKSDSSD